MRKLVRRTVNRRHIIIFAIWLILISSAAAAEENLVGINAYAVLAGNSIKNVGADTLISGNMAIFPGKLLSGTDKIKLFGEFHQADNAARQAQAVAAALFKTLHDLPAMSELTGKNLGGLYLRAEVFAYRGSATLQGRLIIDFAGAPNRDAIFIINGDLTIAAKANILIHNTDASNHVYFLVDNSVTIGSDALVVGNTVNIIAHNNISFASNVKMCGRAFALTGNVILADSTIINNCPP